MAPRKKQPTRAELDSLAELEVAETKRLKATFAKRREAVRLFAEGADKLAEAERLQAEAEKHQAEAVSTLSESGLGNRDIASLLGIPVKRAGELARRGAQAPDTTAAEAATGQPEADVLTLESPTRPSKESIAPVEPPAELASVSS